MSRHYSTWNLFASASLGLAVSLAATLAPAQQPARSIQPQTAADFNLLLTGAVEHVPEQEAPEPAIDDPSTPAAPAEPALAPADGDKDAKATDGTTEIIRERYPNRNVKLEREVAQDAFENYINHGAWKMWDPQGNLIATGQFLDGARQGVWKRWHVREDSKLFASLPYQQFSAPFISQASFQDGQLHGNWAIYDAKQRKISEWEFSTARRHGASVWWYANGRKMREIHYQDGLLDGKFQEWNPAGEIVTDDTYQQGRRLAPRVAADNLGEKKSEGMYLHAKIILEKEDDWWNAQPATFTREGTDEKHGAWTSWYANGQTQMQGEYKHDVEDGVFTWWYPNGQKALEGDYRQGKQHGKWTWWHKNGQKMTQGQYTAGEQTGRWIVWNEEGKVAQAAEHNASQPAVVANPEQAQALMMEPVPVVGRQPAAASSSRQPR